MSEPLHGVATEHIGTDPHAASTRIAVRRALVSVSDKRHLDQLVLGLHAAGVEIVSTGQTAAMIASLGVPVTPVADVTGFPECLDGRDKTLHPNIHGGLLADPTNPAHSATLHELKIEPFQLLVVNLYPFADTVSSGADPDVVIENIDIGGPAMVRAAAKNHAGVAVITQPSQYSMLLEAVAAGGFNLAGRRVLAAAAFAHTATYDVHVASWLGNVLAPTDAGFPTFLGATYTRQAVLRYGENPHQRSALYVQSYGGDGIAQATQLQGKEMSHNNYVDADAALRAAYDHDMTCVAIIKHTNPCGIAVGNTVAEAHRAAHACDPVSSYGGVIATNATVTVEMATTVAEIFTEVLIAPAYDDAALEILATRANLRVLLVAEQQRGGLDLRPISGGVLLQTSDALDAPGDDPDSWTLAAGEAADPATLGDLLFAWRACRAVKSNAILLARHGATVGIGMGQVNRVDSARLAVERAGAERAVGAVGASDAFFPFPDGLVTLAIAGVRAIVQPGGSVRDAEVIAAAQEHHVTLYLTGARHFLH